MTRALRSRTSRARAFARKRVDPRGRRQSNVRGAALTSGFAQSVLTLPNNPLVAFVLGVVLGVGLLSFSRLSFKFMTPDNPAAGLALVGILLFARMGLAVGILLLARALLSSGFMPFAIGFAGGFFVSYTINLVRYSGVRLQSR